MSVGIVAYVVESVHVDPGPFAYRVGHAKPEVVAKSSEVVLEAVKGGLIGRNRKFHVES